MTTLGFKYSEESRKRMSIAQTGRKHSEEAKAKMRAHVFTDEHRRKMSESAKGRVVSIETSIKCSIILRLEECALDGIRTRKSRRHLFTEQARIPVSSPAHIPSNEETLPTCRTLLPGS